MRQVKLFTLLFEADRSLEQRSAANIKKCCFLYCVVLKLTDNNVVSRYLFRVALLQDRLAAAARKQPMEESPTQDPVIAHLPMQTAQEPILQ